METVLSHQPKQRINRPALLRQINLRGWTWGNLAEKAEIGKGSVTAIKKGEPVSARVFDRVLAALQANPPSPLARELMEEESA